MRSISARRVTAIVATLAVTLYSHLSLAQEMDDVEITAEKVADGIYMLLGRGGKIAVAVDDDQRLHGEAILGKTNAARIGDHVSKDPIDRCNRLFKRLFQRKPRFDLVRNPDCNEFRIITG